MIVNLLATFVALSASAQVPSMKPVATVEGWSEYQLPNGLKVLLFPDASKSSVAVNLTVFVGSRHENYGEKGMAHLFEHMLFKKTKKIASIKDELARLGGSANGTTSFDRTNYFEIFSAGDDRLNRAIDLEAERFRNAVISREQLSTEMTVVRNEFERGENSPPRVLSQRMMSAAFAWHNYGHETIGARSDIEQVSNEQLRKFYDTYYQPDNAMLIVAGKFELAPTLKKIASSFGRFAKPKRALPLTYTAEPAQTGEVSVVVRRVGGAPQVAVGYHTPAGSDVDAVPLDVLASMMSTAPSGRLYKNLVEAKKAASVSCGVRQHREAGFFMCRAELQASDAVADAKSVLVETIESLAKTQVTLEEVSRAKAALAKEVELLSNEPEHLALVMSEYAALGDWRLFFVKRDQIEKVTADDVIRVANTYLRRSNRTLGEYVPTPEIDRVEVRAMGDLAPVVAHYKGRGPVEAGEAFDATPLNLETRTQRSTLESGVKLALLPKKTRGAMVHGEIAIQFGTLESLKNQRVAANAVARMLLRGTKTKSRQQVKDLFDQLKAHVSVSPQPQAEIVSFEVNRENLKPLVDLLFDCLKNPAFNEAEFEALRREQVAFAESKKDDPSALGMTALQRALAEFDKSHPFYVPTWPEIIADAKSMRVDQLRAFHGKYYGSGAALVALVGDFDATEAMSLIDGHTRTFRAAEKYEEIVVRFAPSKVGNSVIETPDKAMAFFGAGSTFRLKDSDPEAAAMVLGDHLLGGGFMTGRVTQRLREKEGLSYSAGTNLRLSAHDDNAALLGFAIFAPQNADKVEQGFFEELKQALDAGFSEKELNLAKEGLLKEREQSRTDDGTVAMMLIEQLDLNRSMAWEQQRDQQLQQLTAAEILSVLKKFIDPNRFVVFRAGDFKKTEGANVK